MIIKTVGIMHSGLSTDQMNQTNITTIKNHLSQCNSPPNIPPNYILWADKNGTPAQMAQTLIQANVDMLIAAGGSRSAEEAIKARTAANANGPIIIFTSVSPHVLNRLPANVTGVCAHSSDYDVARFNWLIQMPLRGPRIGVLFNSERTDTTNQMGALTKAASDAAKVPGAPKYHLVPRDINGLDSLDDLFDLFKGDIHALIVAAHPWFNNHRQDVVNGVTAGNFPAIFQWRDFVELGGLMSFGPQLPNLYDMAGKMAADIVNSTTTPPSIPPYQEPADPQDFELVVKKTTAQHFGMWPLPPSVAAKAVVI